MTHYIEGATVWHVIEWWDHVEDQAEAHCGAEGTAVEADPVPEEVCRSCLKASPLHVAPDDEDDDEDDDVEDDVEA